MIRLSTNVVTALLTLLERISSNVFNSYNDMCIAPAVAQINIEDVYEFATACKWTECGGDSPSVTKTGEELVEIYTSGRYEQCFRMVLYYYILYIRPIWSNRIPYGRKEASLFMSKDEKACFMEGNLLSDNPSLTTVEWWDKLAALIRKDLDDEKTSIGRIGERLTIGYERTRTLKEPYWISIDSNLTGYDIKSVISKEDKRPILIEVKASTLGISKAEFYVTVNEWNTAASNGRYYFYLWLIANEQSQLAILTPKQIEKYLPVNQDIGSWELAKIPFIAFENEFIKVKKENDE